MSHHPKDPSPSGRIDLQTPCVLVSFIEPLNALLEVDEIEDARARFEGNGEAHHQCRAKLLPPPTANPR
ncbi:hypothetical protein TNCV_2757231 [Trichonephila clavipes]|nr:hypothetical protein TNCV_2757231 [Trichonephila clavipes]